MESRIEIRRADRNTSPGAAAMYSAKLVDLSLLVVRIIVGLIFAVHGYQKIFTYGMSNVVAMMGAGPVGYLVCIGEFLGGLGIMVGFLSRFSAASNIVIMLGAIAMVHGQHGFLMGQDPKSMGFEYNLALIGLLTPVLLLGPGRYALGRLLPLPKQPGGRPKLAFE
jgi:putative oxidoreductase